jgi:acetyl esterase/lipase
MYRVMKLDPEIAKGIASFPALDLRNVNAARAIRERMREAANIPRPTDDRIIEVEKTIHRPDNESNILIRIYTPKERDGLLPGLVFFHGGGFVMGDLESTHPRCLRLASGGAVVVSVDYRLAPEHPFPAGIEDCYTALQWTADHAVAIGVNPKQLAVGGVSAGGCLAAGVALMARDREGPAIGFQLLIYPVLDDRLQTPSMRKGAQFPIWNSRNCTDMWHHYLGAQRNAVSPYAAPAHFVMKPCSMRCVFWNQEFPLNCINMLEQFMGLMDYFLQMSLYKRLTSSWQYSDVLLVCIPES